MAYRKTQESKVESQSGRERNSEKESGSGDLPQRIRGSQNCETKER